jgi:hypothetical protein
MRPYLKNTHHKKGAVELPQYCKKKKTKKTLYGMATLHRPHTSERSWRAWGMAQVVEHLRSKSKALSSNSSTAIRKKKSHAMQTYN